VKKNIRLMQERSLAEIIADPEIQAEYARLYENHLRNIDMIRKEGSCQGGGD
jgi:predicted urease superfamily metal-dependent hydrolase